MVNYSGSGSPKQVARMECNGIRGTAVQLDIYPGFHCASFRLLAKPASALMPEYMPSYHNNYFAKCEVYK
jgi:hypothetical protein